MFVDFGLSLLIKGVISKLVLEQNEYGWEKVLGKFNVTSSPFRFGHNFRSKSRFFDVARTLYDCADRGQKFN